MNFNDFFIGSEFEKESRVVMQIIKEKIPSGNNVDGDIEFIIFKRTEV